VLSESEFIPVCEEYGFQWTYYNNDPLGEKINAGIKRALEFEWDYLMMMNSDDVILPELVDKYYTPKFEQKVAFFGINRVTYVNFGTTDAVDFKYQWSVLGIGKCFRRDIVEKLKGELYESWRNKGLDDSTLDILIKAGIGHEIVKYEGMLAMDFKSEVNIWPWEHFKDKGTKVCYSLGYGEANLIER
jgi:hypothetical protein